MNRTPDVERVLRDYFADDGLTAPDYVLDTVEGRISRQRQRRSWRLPWRNPMSTPFKLAAGLAAVVLVALVGWQLLPGQPGIGGPQSPTPTQQPSATPVPSASPSVAPSQGAACPGVEDRRVRRWCRDPGRRQPRNPGLRAGIHLQRARGLG